MKNILKGITFIFISTLLISCATQEIKKPLSYKQFKINNETLDGKKFKLKDVYFVKLIMSHTIDANGETCYIMEISKEKPVEQSNSSSSLKKLKKSDFMMGENDILFIPQNKKELLNLVYDFKFGEKISLIEGIGSYPYMNVGYFMPTMKIPLSTVGMVITSIRK